MIVGEAAKATGLSVKTLRYYEEIKLVIPDRQENGYRVYAKQHIEALCFIQRARAMGFLIEDCRALLYLYHDKSRKSSDVKSLAEKHLKTVEAKIATLQMMHHSLSHLVKDCKGDDKPDCPILKNLSR